MTTEMTDRLEPDSVLPDQVTLLLRLLTAESRTHALYKAILRSELRLPASMASAIEQAGQEDRGHLEDLKGLLPLDVAMAAAEASYALRDPEALEFDQVLAEIERLERLSVRAYTQICHKALDGDYRLFDVAFRNLQDNLVHAETLGQMRAGTMARSREMS
ncbi:MAG: hypothetical protein AAGI72_16750 [Pseudomonadota bacterium]